MARVVVTGTSRGIGFEVARFLADKNHSVLALSRNDKPIKALEHPNISALSCDLCTGEGIVQAKEFLDKNWDTVDILINVAGALLNKPFMDTTEDEFRQIYEVNVFGVARIIKEVVPKMHNEGHVVTISSMGGVQGSMKFPGLSAYSSSKGAVITLTELLAEEFKETGPNFNVLALGAVQTEMLEEAFPGYQAPITAREMAEYVVDFALNGHKYYNGKLLQVSSSTP